MIPRGTKSICFRFSSLMCILMTRYDSWMSPTHSSPPQRTDRRARGFRMFPRKPLREQPYRAPSPLAGKGATGESGDSPANCGPGFSALSCGASVAARAPATIGEPQLSPSLQPSPPLRLPSSPNRLPSPTQPRRRRARPPPLPAPSARALQTPPAQPPLHPVQTPKAPGKTGRRQLR